MEFRILGPLEVVGGGGPLDVGGPKVRILLAALIVKAGQVVSTDRLYDILWGPEPPDGAPATLQSHVSHLRAALEPDRRRRVPGGLVVTREPGYLLAVEPEDVDARRFERLVAEARRTLRAAPETAAAQLRQALELWRGEPLADFTFETFAQGEIARLSELRLYAVEDQIDADLAMGKHAEVVGTLRTLVGEHALRERLWAQLMLALYRDGRQAEALRAFSQLREILAEQLGIEPSPDLARLEESILLQKPVLDWQPPPEPTGAPTTPIAASPAVAAEPVADGPSGRDLLEEGRRAFARQSWEEAYQLLRRADEGHGLGPDDLESMGWSAFWSGRPQETVAIAQRVHTHYMETGNRRRAALAAVMVCLLNAAQLRISVAAGWFAMASQLLADEPECVEHGYLSWTTTTVLVVLSSGDPVSALEHAGRTLEIATRYGDEDLRAVALTYKGYVLVRQGEMTQGMAFLDEAMATAVAGHLTPLATATVICRTLSTCVDVFDYRRAGEWLDAIEQGDRPPGMAGFPGDCRIHHAQVRFARGDWFEAELEARQACSDMDNFVREHAGLAFYAVGEIHRLRGDLAGAEEAFGKADDLGRTPQPGRALLQLAKGDHVAAAASIRRALTQEPWNLLIRARLLVAEVEIDLAGGDVDSARQAASELSDIAKRYGTPGFQAAADYAQGVTSLAGGRASEAVTSLEQSWQQWRTIGAPYDAARARFQLGAALSAAGDQASGTFECNEARRTFERVGAHLDAERANAISTGATSPSGGLTP